MKNKKVFIMDNIQSPYVEQAIIILKDHAKGEQSDIVNEAERIVKEYLQNTSYLLATPKKNVTAQKFFHACIWIFAILAVIFISMLVTKIL